MLMEALAPLAAAGGTAVVQAAGTDAWNGFRQAVARWFGQGDAQREQAALDRLDQTATALQTTDPAEAERMWISQEVSWQARVETVLEDLDEAERDRAADQLRDLLAEYVPQIGVAVGQGGLGAGRDVKIHARDNSIAAGVLHGGARIGPPPTPDPPQG
ncbi:MULTISPECIES: hypothetical protein [unclassified Streptomyces]|uniref:hypothetical protein n=1 Tax=unclassified Streptomyces TaxID=2593676 RepID=UPI000748EC5F|nr:MULTISPECIES: hypothetical protein [unclassified Streptomyces]KUL69397.1 hypothetical protein ADL33_30930 [Streptomyces sp. NRRL WC-3604]KUL70062.1 hypothetical protein ADL34_28580 [Streptomyces sp. NRRL WC-3605]